LAEYPDSLIARKCGSEIAAEASCRAAKALTLRHTFDMAYRSELAEFDAWLRADGHRRNPGTTADLVAATLFVAEIDGFRPHFAAEHLR
jgi:triphosphoribosyl-dephospho-CoA synthase